MSQFLLELNNTPLSRWIICLPFSPSDGHLGLFAFDCSQLYRHEDVYKHYVYSVGCSFFETNLWVQATTSWKIPSRTYINKKSAWPLNIQTWFSDLKPSCPSGNLGLKKWDTDQEIWAKVEDGESSIIGRMSMMPTKSMSDCTFFITEDDREPLMGGSGQGALIGWGGKPLVTTKKAMGTYWPATEWSKAPSEVKEGGWRSSI